MSGERWTDDHVLGTCQLCGGAVTMPRQWLGLHPPVPRCVRCLAKMKFTYGPLLDMVRPSEEVAEP